MMTRVAILTMPVESGGLSYYAMSGEKRSFGHTAGEALDSLTAQLAKEETGTLVIVQSQQPDHFFNAKQQQRLSELMKQWRANRDRNELLPSDEQAELEDLVDRELRASAARAEGMLAEIGR